MNKTYSDGRAAGMARMAQAFGGGPIIRLHGMDADGGGGVCTGEVGPIPGLIKFAPRPRP